MSKITLFDDRVLYCGALGDYLAARFPGLCIQREGVAQWERRRIDLNGETVAFLSEEGLSAQAVAAQIAPHLAGQARRGERNRLGCGKITRREREVLRYLVKGWSNKDIAKALDLQVVTVKLHVRGICRKLGAANRTQAALIAHENLVE